MDKRLRAPPTPLPWTERPSRPQPSPRAARFTGPVRRFGALALLLLGACASTPLPNASLVQADAAVLRASTALTSTHAQAALRLATDKLARAHAAQAAGDAELATRLAQQVQLDALLAERQAQAVQSRKARLESDAAAQALREELARQPPR